MTTILFIVQIFIVLLLALVILFQKTGSDGLSGLSGGGGGVVSGKAVSNIFTKLTMILAVAFMVNSLLLAKFAVLDTQKAKGIIKSIAVEKKEVAPSVPKAK